MKGHLVWVIREVRDRTENILTECGTISAREKWNVVELEREVESAGSVMT